jgi:UDP-glucose 4-epimerase
VDRLLIDGHEVIAFDNLSTGRLEFLADAMQSSRFTLCRGDLLDQKTLERALPGVDIVFHLAANADVRFGTRHPEKDLQQNTIGTMNVLEAMRNCGVRRIAAASTGSVYGDATVFPTPEDAPFPLQTSLYGASKLATEALLSTYAREFGFQSWIFRFVSILGERYTHGHIFDFCRQLRAHQDCLEVLGNGQQKKSYLYVQDCIDAILLSLKSEEPVNIYNLGTDEYALVDNSIQWICEEMKLSPKISYSGGNRGWVGDSPFILLDCARIRSRGWAPKLGIREGVVRTLRFLLGHPEFFSRA